MRIDEITENQKEDWESLVRQNPSGGFHQSFEWAAFKEAEGWQIHRVGVFNNETLVGGAMAHQFYFDNRTDFIYIPEGPILSYDDESHLFEEWKAMLPRLIELGAQNTQSQTSHIRIEPRLTACPDWFLEGFKKAPLNLFPRHTLEINLEMSENEILAQMKQKGRYNIRLAAKKGVEIRKVDEVQEEDLDRFYSLYETTYKRNEFEGKPKAFFKNFLDQCRKITDLYVAEFEGETIAMAFVIYFGNRSTYLYGASSNEHRNLYGPYALQWRIMKDAKAAGYSKYDLWGISPDASHAWAGITQFKKRFGGEQIDLIGAHDFVVHKKAYSDFIETYENY